MPEQKIKNPFLHTHDHDGECDHHHHEDEAEFLEQLDPAQQSLNDALRVSFSVLKLVMVLLLIAYLFSGIFSVGEAERAVRLRFGKIVGDVYDAGWHFGWPYPIEQKIKVSVSPKTLSIPSAYWYEVRSEDVGRSMEERARTAGPLNPVMDGSLITGDANVVHAKYQVSYRVSDPAEFVRNVGLVQPGSEDRRLPDGSVPRDEMDFAAAIVRDAIEQGIVYSIAQSEIDDVLRSRPRTAAGLRRAQEVLDELQTGLEIEHISLEDAVVPLAVRGAFQAVTNAESEKAQQIESARQERARILGGTAGAAHDPLLALVQAYEQAASLEDREILRSLDQVLADSLGRLALPAIGADGEAAYQTLVDQITTYQTAVATGDPAADTLRTQVLDQLGQLTAASEELSAELESAGTDATPPGAIAIGGDVAGEINRARTYRTATVEQVQSEADQLAGLVDEFNHNPDILLSRLWQNVREEIFTGDVETFYTMPGQHYLVTNRDPRVTRQREMQAREDVAEQAQQQQH
ncbi:MAG: SPFH domain-containing protein [Phycisphaeraceae bacterium]